MKPEKQTPIQRKLSEADEEELRKCSESPVYFYNKYVKPDGQKELTEAEFEDHVKRVQAMRNPPMRRIILQDRPVLPSEAYEKLPTFLNNPKTQEQ